MVTTAAVRRLDETTNAAGPLAIVSDASAADWDAFVMAHGATGYHAWAWRGVFERAFGHETIYLAATRHGRVAGVLPLVLIDSWLFGRTLCSLPFVNYGGVAASDPDAAGALLDRAATIARERRCRALELRHVRQAFPQLPCRTHKVAMHLALAGDAAAVWDALDRKVRNQVRKAQKSGLTAVVGAVDLLDEFYAVFARNMRDLGTPVYARSFFREVLAAFPDAARIHVVRSGNVPVGASLTFRTGDVVEVPWASTVRDYNPLSPNQLLYWSMIERAASDRCAVFDFGRSTPGEGTFKFKQQWGAAPVPLHWEYVLPPGAQVPNTSPTNPKFRTAIAAWKRLPLAIANFAGPHIVRAIP